MSIMARNPRRPTSAKAPVETRAPSIVRRRNSIGDKFTPIGEGGRIVLNKLLDRLQSEASAYAKQALENPVKRDSFEFGKHHGVLVGYSHVEQWIQELLEEEEDDESE
jgi:hypothetical protein